MLLNIRTRQRIIFALFLLYGIGFGTYCMYRTFIREESFWFNGPEKICGIVRYKGDRDQVYKHSSTTEFILVIERGKYLYDETVSLGAYNTHKVGDTYCTDNKELSNRILWAAPAFMLAIVFWVILGVCCIIDIFEWLWMGETEVFRSYMSFIFGPLTNDWWQKKTRY